MKFTVTEHLLEIFDQHKVYFTGNGQTRLRVGDQLIVDPDSKIEPYCAFLRGHKLCSIGSFSYSWSPLEPSLVIGRYCSIASGLNIMGADHPYERFTTSTVTYEKNFIISRQALIDHPDSTFQPKLNPKAAKNQSPTTIGNDVWIGANVTLARGITVGHGAVLATRSVVTKDVPPYTIVGGVPAKPIKMRFDESIVRRMMALRFWDYGFWDFEHYDLDAGIEHFLDVFENKLNSGDLHPYRPEPLSVTEHISPLPAPDS